jgi:hypothetical protein
MTRFLLFLFFTCMVFEANAQQNDTSAYQLQRLKVNALLAQRSARFGQYDKSLDSRTGIFGLQTKGDIKKSNEILRQIVLNDNNIFKELKILLDYKDQEIKKAQLEASTSNSRIENYMQTIKKLQDQNEQLKKQEGTVNSAIIPLLVVLTVCLAGLSFFFYRKFKRASQGPF